MTSEIVTDDPELPIEGTTQVSLPVERIWDAFVDVHAWRNWNPCIAWARVGGGELKEGATLYWAFKPIRRHYLYRMPAAAKIVECAPQTEGHLGGERPRLSRPSQLPVRATRTGLVPVRFLGGSRGAGLSRHAPILARPLPLRLRPVARRRSGARRAVGRQRRTHPHGSGGGAADSLGTKRVLVPKSTDIRTHPRTSVAAGFEVERMGLRLTEPQTQRRGLS